MCLGIPGKVVARVAGHPDLAHVEVAGLTRPVNVGLLHGEPLNEGDWVLIHAGFAMEKIDEATARQQLSFLDSYTMDPPVPPPPPPWTSEE
jgi:hydrogenase expression/formation protein HypC